MADLDPGGIDWTAVAGISAALVAAVTVGGTIATIAKKPFTKIHERIDSVASDLRNRIDEVASDSRNRSDEVASSLGNRIDNLGNRIDEVASDLGNRIDEVAKEGREAHALIGKRIDDLSTGLSGQIQTLGRDMTAVRERLGRLEGVAAARSRPPSESEPVARMPDEDG